MDYVAVDRWFENALVGDAPVADAKDLPPHEVSPLQGKLLALLATMVGARRILEIGTLAGYSTLWLARTLPDGGQLVTLEANAHHAEVARANVARAGLAAKVDVRVGPALGALPALEGPFDFVFIDADKANNAAYLDWAIRLSRPGAAIVADNVVRNGAVLDEASTDPSVVGIRRFIEMLSRDARVSATAVQTVSVKGWDGYVLAIVK